MERLTERTNCRGRGAMIDIYSLLSEDWFEQIGDFSANEELSRH